MKTILRKTVKVLKYALLSLFVLLVAIVIALQFSFVQTYIGKIAANIFAEQWDTEVSIDKVKIGFFNQVTVEGLYVEDRLGDTLAHIGRLEGQISTIKLLTNTLKVDKLVLEDVTANVTQSKDSVYNFQFIVDAFSSDTPSVDTSTSSDPFKFQVGKVELRNIRANFTDYISHMKVVSHLGAFELEGDILDLEARVITAKEIALANTQVAYTGLKHEVMTTKPKKEPVASGPLEFPDIGWTFKLGQLKLDNNHVAYHNENVPRTTEGPDFNHLDVSDISIDITDLAWEADAIGANIHQIAFADKSGLGLSQFEASLEATPKSLAVADLLIATKNSRVQNSTRLTMNRFSDLEDFLNKVHIATSFEDSYVATKEVDMIAPGVLDIPELKNPYQQKVHISGGVDGLVKDLSIDNLQVRLAESTGFVLNGTVKGLPEIDNLQVIAELESLSTRQSDLAQLLSDSLGIPEGLKNLGLIAISGNFSGTLDSIKVDSLQLNTDGYTGFNGQITATGLPVMDSAEFTMQIDQLATSYADLYAVLDTTIPAMLQPVDTIVYAGTFEGSMFNFTLSGALKTGVGAITNDFEIAFNDSFSNADYSGDVELTQLDIGKLLTDTSMGKVSMSIDANGGGLAIKDMDVSLNALITEARLLSYNYHNLKINGLVNNQEFKGNIDIDDPNLQFHFDGLFSLDTLQPRYAFKAAIDTINLKPLNLYPETLNLSTSIDADFKGLSADELDGTLAIQEFHLANDSLKYLLPSLKMTAGKTFGGTKTIAIDSDILTAFLSGKFQIASLAGSIQHYIDGHYASSETAKNEQEEQDQQFTLELEVLNPVPLTRLFMPELQQLDTLTLTSTFDNRKQELDLNLYIPGLLYDSIAVANITTTAKGDATALTVATDVTQTVLSKKLTLEKSWARLELKDNQLSTELAIQDNDTTTRLGLNGLLTQHDGKQQFSLQPPFHLNNEAWNIPEGNKVIFGNNYLNIQQLQLQRNGKKLLVQSKNEQTAYAPIEIRFDHFNLAEITDLVGILGFTVEGDMNGVAVVSGLDAQPYLTSDLSIDDILLNDKEVGTLTIKGTGDAKEVNINTALQGANTFTLNGRVRPSDDVIDLKLNLDEIQLGLVDPFLVNNLANTSGYLTGQFNIDGALSEPDVEGFVQLVDVETDIRYLNGRYKIASEKIRLNKENIKVGQVTLTDPAGRKASLKGNIAHQQFNDLQLDLNFKTNEFLFMNTSAADNELLYGKVLMKIDASVTGTPDLPKANVTAKALESTNITLSLVSGEETIKKESFVIFIDKEQVGDSVNIDSLKIIQPDYKASVSGLDMHLNLELTDESQFAVVIDPAAGDKLDCRGNANLSVDMLPSGELRVAGSYVISEGHYSLNQSLLKKDFEIQKGGRIDFTGDIMNARLDLAAIYKLRTTTYGLVASQSTTMTESEKKAAKEKQNVDVYLKMKGQLKAPELSFDIQLPDLSSNAVSSTVERKLSEIRDDESELSKQVFGLLLLNSFIVSNESSETDFGSAGRGMALSSVSNLITGQLNKLAQNARGVDIDFLLDSYDDKFSEAGADRNITQMGLKVSTELPNDRIVLSVGGDMMMETESQSSSSDGGTAMSTVSGEFVLQYKLTKVGRYRLKVFQNTDFDLLTESNDFKTGAGVSFQQSFGDPTKKAKAIIRKEQEALVPKRESDN